MRRWEPASSLRQPAAWLFAGAGLLLYLWVPSTLFGMVPGRGAALPGWLSLAVPPVVYGALVACFRRLSLVRQLTGIAGLWAVHALLGFVADLLYAPVGPFPLAAPLGEILWAFPVLALLQVLAVPLAVFPLRDLLLRAPRRRPSRLRVERAPTPTPTRAERTPTPPPARPASPSDVAMRPAVTPTPPTVTLSEGPAPWVPSASRPIFELAPEPSATSAEPPPVALVGEGRRTFEVTEPTPREAPPVVVAEPPDPAEAVLAGVEIPEDLPALAPAPDAIVDTLTVEAAEPEPPCVIALEDGSGAPAAVDPGPLPAIEVVPDIELEPALPPEPAVALPDEPASPAPTTEPMLRPIHLAEAQKISATLARYGSLKVEPQVVMGLTLFTAASRGLDRSAVLGAAFRFLPLLAESPGPMPVTQATLRGAGGAMVLTPLGAVNAGGPVLVVAVRRRGALALLERLSLQIAAEYQATHPESAASDRESEDRHPGAPSLGEVQCPPHLAGLAERLDAFGRVTPSGLRDPAGARLYLFLGPGVDGARVGRFAWELYRATELDGEVGGIAPLESLVLSLDGQQVVVRPVAGARAPVTLLVAAGADAGRPGLAYRQLERAATSLAAG